MPTTQPHAASLLRVLLQLPQRDVGLLAHGGPQLLLYLRRQHGSPVRDAPAAPLHIRPAVQWLVANLAHVFVTYRKPLRHLSQSYPAWLAPSQIVRKRLLGATTLEPL